MPKANPTNLSLTPSSPAFQATLRRLAEQLPWRVKVHSGGVTTIIHSLGTTESSHPLFAEALERTLREECEARGWRWWAYRTPKGYRAAVYVTGNEEDELVSDSPAHALGLAMLHTLTARSKG